MNYRIIKTTLTLENKAYISYGIECESEIIEDISTDYEAVKKLVSALNENNISPFNLREFVEDMLWRLGI